MTYATTEEVASLLRVHKRTVERRMRETPDHIHKPWVRFGRMVRWHLDQVDTWARELSEWQASRDEEAATASALAGSTAAGGSRAPARTSRRRGGSSVTSREPMRSAKSGSLVVLARSLGSME